MSLNTASHASISSGFGQQIICGVSWSLMAEQTQWKHRCVHDSVRLYFSETILKHNMNDLIQVDVQKGADTKEMLKTECTIG